MKIFFEGENSVEGFSRRLIGWSSLLLGFADALWLYLASTYIRQATGSDNVGLFYLAAYVVILVILFFLHTLIHWLGKTTLFSILLFTVVTATIFLSVVPVSMVGIVALMLLIVGMTVAWVALDTLLEDVSEDERSGRIRGLHLTLVNAGILGAPFLASRILDRFDFSGVFFGSALVYMAVFLLVTVGLRRTNHRFRERILPLTTWRKVRQMPDILRIYGASLALEFFFAIMVIYAPFRLLELGFSWTTIGSMYTIMLIPFVLIQYPAGRLADMRWGEKEMLLGALAIMILTTGATALTQTTSFIWWAGMLCLSRVGAATLEVLRDSYFYKHIDGDDGDLIAFFRTSRPVGNILAALLAAGTLLFFSLGSVFWLSAGVSLLALIGVWQLQDTRN
jgi:MFS family permease